MTVWKELEEKISAVVKLPRWIVHCESVLLNLLNNAVDAVQELPRKVGGTSGEECGQRGGDCGDGQRDGNPEKSSGTR